MGQQKGLKRALPDGYILCGKYRIGQVIGEGGFGITYSGTRLADDRRVAIKEYFPAQYASREDGCADCSLHIFYGEKSTQFEKGLVHFKHEAEILKQYSYLDGMVTVLDMLEANHTAYIIMEFVEGITLSQYIRENGVFSYNELVQLMTPIMKSLAQIHRQGIIHRDISPENIQIGLDNCFYLLDFGAAKELDNQNPQNTIIFKQGYAPPEQYTGGGKQGPWTDVYALAATMYTALAGEQPVDAVLRMQNDEMEAEYSKLSGMTDWQRNALKKGLELKPAERYQNMETFLSDLSVKPRIEEQKTLICTEEENGHRYGFFADRTQSRKNGSEPDQIKNRKRYSFIGWVLGVLLLAMLSGMAIHIWDGQTASKADTKGNDKGQIITEQQNDPEKDSPEDTGMDKSEADAQQASTTESAAKQKQDTSTSEGAGSTAEIYNRQTTEKTKDSTGTSSKTTKTATTEGTTASVSTTSQPTTEKPTTEAATTESKKKKSSSKDDDIIVGPDDEDVIID
ncbi:MAG: serine/threonine-protein kinase [Coprococcus sp.]|nr:serine/threonine-protein kinase [Coprococcus sp.]